MTSTNVHADTTVQVEAEQRFAIIPEWLLDAEVPDRAIRIYGLLARYGNGSGRREVARATLARRAGCSLDSVDRALRALVDVEALSMSRTTTREGDPGPNRYVLLTSGGVAARVPTPGRTGTERGGRTGAGRVAAPERHDREDLTERTRTETRDPNPGCAVVATPEWDWQTVITWQPPGTVATGGCIITAAALCDQFAADLTERGVRVPDGRARSKAWIMPMEALLRIDQRPVEAVERVMRWLHGGRDRTSAFWQGVVLSPDKLRLRWDQMGQQYRAANRVTDRNAGVLDDGTDLADLLATRRGA